MGGVLALYKKFFDLFEDFEGYVDFFLLQDIVSKDSSRVEFFMPFANFTTPPLPRDDEEYQGYRQNALCVRRGTERPNDRLRIPPLTLGIALQSGRSLA